MDSLQKIWNFMVALFLEAKTSAILVSHVLKFVSFDITTYQQLYELMFHRTVEPQFGMDDRAT